MDISRRSAVGGTESAARRGSGGIDRHVIDRLTEGIREAEVQPLFKPSMSGNERAMVVGISEGVLEENLAELRIGPEVICREAMCGDGVNSSQAIGKVSKGAN